MDQKQLLEHKNAEIILDKSWHLFQQKGYRGFTVDEICLQCNITKPTLYYYFGDKENLFVAVLQHRLQGFHQVLSQPGLLHERLEAFSALIFTSFDTDYNALLRDREHIKQPENQLRVRSAFHDELFSPLKELMQSGIDSGELQGMNAEMLSLIFLGIINNFIGRARQDPSKTDSLAKTLTAFFLQGAKNQIL
jgi:AcrR family transcriptional regulator